MAEKMTGKYTTAKGPWSDMRIDLAPKAPVVDQKWNTRFDYKPSRAQRTYDGKVMAKIGPAPGNKV